MFDNIRNIMNFDEVLFEKRNKDYGAYQLRKRYNSVMVISIIASVLLFSAMIILPFIRRPADEKVLGGGYGGRSVYSENFEMPEEIYLPPVALPPPPARAPQVQKFVPPEVVDTIIAMEPPLMTPEEISYFSADENIDFTGSGSGNGLMGVEGGIDSDAPFFFVEQMPTFRGGDIEKFRLWVRQRTNYPQEAIDKKIRGEVVLTFIIEADGSVSNVTVIRGVDPLIDAEAVRVIQSSPKWSPGIQRGKPVRVRYSLPLNFTF